MKPIIIRHLLCFTAGIIAGIGLFNLFSSGCQPAHPVYIDNPVKIAARVATVEKKYQIKIDSITAVTAALETKVARTQATLKAAIRKNRNLEQHIEELATTNIMEPDPVARLENCDTLTSAVIELLTLNKEKDSLFTEVTNDLQEQINWKDRIILVQQERYDSLKISHDKILFQQQELLKLNQEIQKEVKKQKRNKRFLSFLLITWTSISTWQAIK